MNELPLKVVVAKFTDNYVSIDINRPLAMTFGPGHTHIMFTPEEYAAVVEAQKKHDDGT